MTYAIFALLALPFAALFAFLLLIATGVFHDRVEAEEVAHNYGRSWKSAARA